MLGIQLIAWEVRKSGKTQVQSIPAIASSSTWPRGMREVIRRPRFPLTGPRRVGRSNCNSFLFKFISECIRAVRQVDSNEFVQVAALHRRRRFRLNPLAPWLVHGVPGLPSPIRPSSLQKFLALGPCIPLGRYVMLPHPSENMQKPKTNRTRHAWHTVDKPRGRRCVAGGVLDNIPICEC